MTPYDHRFSGRARCYYLGKATVRFPPRPDFWERTLHLKDGISVRFVCSHLFYLESHPRYHVLRADTLVFGGGYVVLDVHTGFWRRFAYSSAIRKRLSLIQFLLTRRDRLDRALASDEWPPHALRQLHAIHVRLILMGWPSPHSCSPIKGLVSKKATPTPTKSVVSGDLVPCAWPTPLSRWGSLGPPKTVHP